jgi:hypothetical protein
MRRALLLVLVVALGALVFVPAASAQDDNPSGDDLGGDVRGGSGQGSAGQTGRSAQAGARQARGAGEERQVVRCTVLKRVYP